MLAQVLCTWAVGNAPAPGQILTSHCKPLRGNAPLRLSTYLPHLGPHPPWTNAPASNAAPCRHPPRPLGHSLLTGAAQIAKRLVHPGLQPRTPAARRRQRGQYARRPPASGHFFIRYKKTLAAQGLARVFHRLCPPLHTAAVDNRGARLRPCAGSRSSAPGP
jgi:hypothetical protein